MLYVANLPSRFAYWLYMLTQMQTETQTEIEPNFIHWLSLYICKRLRKIEEKILHTHGPQIN